MARDKVNVNGGSGEGTWCTEKWLADVLGWFDLDPCSNPRSHIQAHIRLMLEMGDDGCVTRLQPGTYYVGDHRNAPAHRIADENTEGFYNPPYSRGEVIKWVRHYMHTRFTFLLKFAPDTGWFETLLPACTHLWWPIGRRLQFEPPPGVVASSNPFPHALYMRNPPQDRLNRLMKVGLVAAVDAAFLDAWLENRSVDTALGTG